ncbi:BRO-N domain-containing protein [Adonisia turfae]|uniref:Bro-N domain-containing protein n=1 Tax=Adonisia turfae CCMR0081 TaxID=2292702 RepID=A0A6M0RGK1_9CYAN|nr:BRO family protein [Adonisia turfae]NEZ55030.1 hypothetical protein [Adonisia turfae CCMR0081]
MELGLSDTLGGKQDLLTVNEPGLYELVFGSRKPEAKRFKRWLKHEVLPAIRKTGSYSLQKTDSVPEPQPLQLPPADVRLQNLAITMRDLKEMLGQDFINPRVQQNWCDMANNIVAGEQKQLPPGSEKADEWMGIVEFAEKLGYKVPQKLSSTLGKRAKAWFVETYNKNPYEERRLVNGRMCPVKLYNVTECGEGLSQIVREYLGEAGGLAA